MLAVEKCMLTDLAHVLAPDVIIALRDDKVSGIAAESESSVRERQRASETLKSLEEGLEILTRFSHLTRAGASTLST